MDGVEVSDEQRERIAKEVTRIGDWLCDLYALDFEIQAGHFLVSGDLAQELLPEPRPRTGLIAIEEGEELQLGIYFDPEDQRRKGTLVEETSHLVCLAWHGAQNLPISPLALELQGEVDRFLYGCHVRFGSLAEGLSSFDAGHWADWLDEELLHRYRVARDRARRYCHRLVDRFAPRRDLVGLAGELRRFYRTSPATKLRI